MSHRRIQVLVVLFYCGLAILATYPLVMHFTTHVPSGSGDAAQDLWEKLWNLDHVYRRVTTGQSPFSTSMLYYPNGASLYFHPLSITNALLVLPIIAIVGVIPAYNTLVMVSFVASGYVVYLLCRQWQCSHGGALIGGMIYTLSSFHVGHLTLNHLELWTMHWLPLYMLAYERARLNPSRWRIVATILALLAVIFSSLYMAMYAALWTLVWVLADMSQHPRTRSTILARLRVPIVVGGSSALIITPLLVIPMFRESAANPVLVRSVEEISKRVIQPWSIVQRSSLAYLGIGALMLMGIGIVRTKSRGLRWIMLAGIGFWLALGPRYGLYTLYNQLPIAQFGRYPDRFIVLSLISVAVLAAMGVTTLVSRWQPRWKHGSVALFMVLIALDSWQGVRPLLQPTVHPVYAMIAADPHAGSVLDMPIRRTNSAWLAMYYQTVHQHPILDGALARPVSHVSIFAIQAVRALEQKPDDLPERDIVAYQDPLATTTYFNLRYLVYYRKSDIPTQQVPTREQIEASTGAQATEIANDAILVAYRLEWNPANQTIPAFMEVGNGWYDREGDDATVHRWIEDVTEGATIRLYPTQAGQKTLMLNVVAFDHPQAVDVYLDATLLTTLHASTTVETFSVPVTLEQRNYTLRFKPHEQGMNPSLAGQSTDNRFLSIGIFGVDLK